MLAHSALLLRRGVLHPELLRSHRHVAQHCMQRSLHASASQQATYRRFGDRVEENGSKQPGNAAAGGAAPLQQLAMLAASRLAGGGKGGGGGGAGKPGAKGGRSTAVFYVLIGGAGLYYVVNLERVPSTGRLRFLDVNVREEREMAESTFQQVLKENQGKLMSSSDPQVRQIRAIADRLIDAAHRSEHPSEHLNDGSYSENPASDDISASSSSSSPSSSPSSEDVNWEVFVIKDDKEKNAFVLANGKIFVYTGILPICQDQDGLATVLGHEVAHQVARHTAEKMSGLKVVMFAGILLQAFGLDFGLSQVVSQLLLSLPNSRKVETEADQIGLQLMSMACFDPRNAPSVWERMQKEEGGGGGGIIASTLSTHPVSSKRMKALQQWLPEAIKTREEAGCPDSGVMQGFQATKRSIAGALS